MSTPESRSLRDLRQLKTQAKELLRAFRAGEREAVGLVSEHFRVADPERFRLAQAQLVLARKLGYRSWARLRQAAGATGGSRRPRTRPGEMDGRYIYDVDPVDGDQAWEFFEACRDGDAAAVRRLISADPALVHAQYWYTQPIHFAVYANRPEIVRILLEADTEPGRTRFMDSGWKKLVRHARQMGFHEVRGLLVSAARDRFGYDPDFEDLRQALLGRAPSRVADLLAERPHLARACDLQGNTAVHWAVMTRQPEPLPTLADHGANPNQDRSDGQTPAQLLFNGDYEFRVWRDLRDTAYADEPTMIRALVAIGAEIDLSVACALGDRTAVEAHLARDPESANRLDSGRRSPLTYAARGGHLGIVRLLLESGADPSRPEELADRGHALWMACARGHTEMVRVLLAHGADPNAAPDSSDSCLGIARARAGDAAPEIERLLVAHGATASLWHMDVTELRRALEADDPVTRKPGFVEEVLARNDPDLAALLLKKDPDAAERLHGGALRRGSPEVAIREGRVLRLLLDHGFDPNRPGWLGKTALHHYAGRGEMDNVLLLIEHGADLDALEDEFQGTPLAWAAAEGHEDVVALLLEHGADPSLPRDISAAQPLARARAGGHADVVHLLDRAVRAE